MISTSKLPLNSVSELPGHRICWAQPYIRAYSIPATGVLPRQLPEDSRHFKHTKTQPSKRCVSSALIPGHWGISRVLCHLKLTLRERERWERERVGCKTHTVIHTFSLLSLSHRETQELSSPTLTFSAVYVCVTCDLTICSNLIVVSYHITVYMLCLNLDPRGSQWYYNPSIRLYWRPCHYFVPNSLVMTFQWIIKAITCRLQ